MNRALSTSDRAISDQAISDDAAGGPGRAVPAEWLTLADAASESNPFYHPALLAPALDHLDPGGQVRVIEARADGRLIGLLPVVPQSRHSRYPVRNVGNWAHDHCFYGAPLLRASKEREAWALLLAQLDGAAWAGHFLHLERLDPDGPAAVALHACCAEQRRPIKRIGLYERALLRSDLSARRYWEAHVRAKKRKEIRRLVNRLEECGTVTHRRLDDPAEATRWGVDFLALEAAGWKGRTGTAIGNHNGTRRWFAAMLTGAARAGMLDMLRIDVDGAPIAMLINFRHGRGAYSYKIAFDESHARYSPGILIELDNLHAVLGDGETPRPVDWMDSCAAPDHPMIDSLWAERRRIGQFRVALGGQGPSGLARRAAFAAISLAENALHSIRKEKI